MIGSAPAEQRGMAVLPAWAAPLALAAAALTCCTAVGLANPTQPGNVLPHCPFKALTGWDCPGCGSTRMLYAVLHGDPAGAAGYNIVALILMPALIWAWLAWSLPRLGGPRLPAWHPSGRAIRVGLAIVLLFTVARNLPWAPFAALHV